MAKPSLLAGAKSRTKSPATTDPAVISPPDAVTSAGVLGSPPPVNASGAVVPFSGLIGMDKALAAVLAGTDNDGSAILPGDPPGNFVMFAHPMSKRYPAQAAAIPGLSTFAPVLVAGNERPQRLNPFRCHYLTGWQYWAHVDNDGTLIDISLTKPADRDSKLQETVDTVLLVHTPDGIRAARCRFRSAMTRAVGVMDATLSAAKTAEWGRLSPAHAETLALPLPFQRCVFEITTAAKTSKRSGNQYGVAEAIGGPTTARDLRELAPFYSQPSSVEEFKRTWEAFSDSKRDMIEEANKRK